RRLEDYYRSFRFMDVRVFHELQCLLDGSRWMLVFHVEEGTRTNPDDSKPARVGQIFILGNEKIPHHVILDRIPLYPGQLLNDADLRKAERNLARLNLFDPEPTLAVANPDDDSEYKDILVTVQEAQTGSLLLGVGVNADAGLTGSVVLNESNFDFWKRPG